MPNLYLSRECSKGVPQCTPQLVESKPWKSAVLAPHKVWVMRYEAGRAQGEWRCLSKLHRRVLPHSSLLRRRVQHSLMRSGFARKPDFCCKYLQQAERQLRLCVHQVDEIFGREQAQFRTLHRLRCQGVRFHPNRGRHAEERASAHPCGQYLLALQPSGQPSRPLCQDENADWSVALTEDNTIRAKSYRPRSSLQCLDQFVIGNKCARKFALGYRSIQPVSKLSPDNEPPTRSVSRAFSI